MWVYWSAFVIVLAFAFGGSMVWAANSFPINEAVAISILIILATILLVLLIRSHFLTGAASSQRPMDQAQRATENDIEEWLTNLGMSEYTRRFKDNEIDIAMLSRLTSADLQQLNIPIPARLKILGAAEDHIKR